MNNRNIALIGLGHWGKNIFRILYEIEVLHTACDNDLIVLKELNNAFENVKYTDSLENILRNKEIKAIAIATPSSTHYEFAKQSLIADKDVFIEKPLSLNTKEGAELVELAKTRNKILMVGHILQYHPAIIKLKELISLGELGKIQYIYSNRLNIGRLRTEENILWSFAPHDISVILMLLEEDPIQITASGSAYLNVGINDVTLTNLEFKNNIKAHIFVSWLHPFKEQKLIVIGSKAMAVFDDLTKDKLFVYPHKVEWKNGKIPVVQKAEYRIIQTDNKEPLKLELECFIDSILTRRNPKTDGNEGLRVLKVLEAAEKSLCNINTCQNNLKHETYFAHKTAFIDQNTSIGEGTNIWHFSHILEETTIGKNCKIGQNVVIGPKVKIGNGCKIQNNISIYEGVTFEDNVFCGPSCVFTNVINPRSEIARMKEIKPTIVKSGASIGANATIICGNTLGRYSFVGAGSVITNDIPDYALVYGNPGRIKGWICECGTKLKFSESFAVCEICKKQYQKSKYTVERIKNERIVNDGSKISV